MEQDAIVQTLAEHGARIVNLEGWQKVQNGSLQRIEDRVNKLYLATIALLATVVGSMAVLLVRG
ncbi:MAG: hypothetical protein AB1609_00805 [Bacillota bacterium]